MRRILQPGPRATWPISGSSTRTTTSGFEELGGYLGYRVGIREDGTWLYFIAGD